ncbi:MAG: hypothetical protein ABI467_03370 [Kofleriaceae bacterium]
MRRSVLDQLSLVPAPFGHEHVRELQAARGILDRHPEFARWVQTDLLVGGIDADHGRNGMSGEQVQHSAKAEQRLALYRDLVKVTANTVADARFSVERLAQHFPPEAFQQPELAELRDALKHYVSCAQIGFDLQVKQLTRQRGDARCS